MSRVPGARTVIAVAAIGVLTLAACTTGSPHDESPENASTGVTSVDSADLARDPADAANPPAMEVPELQLPLQSEDAQLVAPGWEVTPQQLDGIFMAPVDVGGHLEFTAIDSTGEALWTVERPLACTGFTLTIGADGTPLAVINDVETTGTAIAETTASAYNLRTGDLVWGPVQVPGPHHGPGLVYASPSDAPMGASGPRVALSSHTGEIVADGSDPAWSVVAENQGSVLLTDGQSLRAVSSDGETAWESGLPSGLDSAQAASSLPIGPAVQALRSGEGQLTIIGIATGSVLATSATSAVVDASTGTLIATDAAATTGVSIVTGETVWTTPSSPQAKAMTAAGAQVYVRDGDAIRVQNTITGTLMPGYPELLTGTIAVPHIMTGNGAAAYAHEGQILLATTPGS